MATDKPPRASSADTKQQIIDAALTLLLKEGLPGATARKIAAQAGVSPGTMTYHFASVNDVLHEAFMKVMVEVSTVFAERLRQASDIESAREAVVDLIAGDLVSGPRHMLLSFELYAFASRNPEQRVVSEEWMRRSRAALHTHFDAATSRALDAMIEGYTIHNWLNRERASRAEIAHAVSALTR